MGEDALERYARGSPPLRDSSEALDFQELLAAWDEAFERINDGLAGLPRRRLRPAGTARPRR